jgi:hypothetical protein
LSVVRETAHAVQLVAEEVETRRLVTARRKDVDDAAAQRVLAGLADRAGAAVAVPCEEAHQRLAVDALAHAGPEDRALKRLARRHQLQDRADGGEQESSAAARRFGKPGQCVDTTADDVAVGGDPIVGHAVPGRHG